jgi:hypothetical protein
MKTDAAVVAWRLYVIMSALTGTGVLVGGFLYGPAAALGFLAGAAMSFANAYWMHRIAMSIGQGSKPKAASMLAIFRYLLMLAIVYAILDVSKIGFFAALAGCFIHIVAVILEVVYELTYGTS